VRPARPARASDQLLFGGDHPATTRDGRLVLNRSASGGRHSSSARLGSITGRWPVYSLPYQKFHEGSPPFREIFWAKFGGLDFLKVLPEIFEK
jgi:hypothetical protein